MAVKITLTNSSRATKKQPSYSSEVTTGNIPIHFSREFYQRLGSLTLNKTLKADYEAGLLPKEYTRFLDEISQLGTASNSAMVELDQYLGSLGMTEEYPYSKDSLNIPAWIPASFLPDQRVLMTTTNQVLMSGNEYLVKFNNQGI